MSRTMPAQKPGRSKQDYGTPLDFIAAVERRFGPLRIDLAATAENKKAPIWIAPESDSLHENTAWDPSGLAWLNPPFANIAPWAAKCAYHAEAFAANKSRLLFLTPASVGSNWFDDHVHKKARVLFLKGRLTFEGCSDPYPKDCILSVFGERPAYEVWDWRKANV